MANDNVANWGVAAISKDGDIVTDGSVSVGQIGTGSSGNTIYGKSSIAVSGSFGIAAGTKIELNSTTGQVFIFNLPTSDPVATNQLWSNAGVLTVSAG